jgi:hypothetical protein
MYIEQLARELEIKVDINGVTYDKTKVVEYKINNSAISEDDFTFGTAISSRLDLQLRTTDAIPENAEIIPWVRMDGVAWVQANIAWGNADFPWNDGRTEWIPLGRFFIDSRSFKNGVYALTCYDKLILSQQTYVSKLVYPTTMVEVFDEICTDLALTPEGITINPDYMMSYSIEDATYRDILGYIAACHASSAQMNKDGNLVFVKFAPLSQYTSVVASNYYSAEQTNPTKTYTKIIVEYNADGETLEIGSGEESQTLKIYNPLMTENILQDMFAVFNGFMYTPFSMDWKGFPHLDIGDGLEITMRDGSKLYSLMLNTTLSFKGGIREKTTASAYSQQQSEFKFKGSINQQVSNLNKTAIKEDKPYYGVTVGRANGVKVTKSDGSAEAVFNADTLAMRAGGEDAIYFDPTTKKYKINGTLEAVDGDFSGTVKAEKIVGKVVASQIDILPDENISSAEDWNTRISDAQSTANTAQTAANNAQTAADTANTKLTDIASDSRLTPVEKQAVKKEWDIIVAEKPTIEAQANSYAITAEKTNYITAYSDLSTYITPLLLDLGTTDDIAGDTFRSKFRDYYDKRTLLLKKISDLAKLYADTAQTAANNAQAVADNAQYAADVAWATADTAQTAANNAQTSATTANNALADIASDSKLTPVEKQATKKEWDVIVSEKSTIDSQATTFAVDRTNYDNQYTALSDYITPLLADLGSTSAIDGPTFRIKFKGYYDARTTLLNAIASKAKTLADSAQTSANNAQAAADNAQYAAEVAQATADTAQTAADTANAALADIASDNRLTPLEKQAVKKEWDVIVSEKSTIDSQADAFGVSKSTYDNQYTALSGYITPLLADLTVTSDIVGTTFRTYFKNYYDARTALLTAVSTKAKQLADTAQTSADNAQAAAVAAQSTADTAKANAATAQTAANNAQTAADTANTKLTDIASDSKLTPVEKQATKKEWDVIVSEKSTIDSQATTFAVDRTNYDNQYTALSDYITPLLADLGSTSAIDGPTFRIKFKGYYDARTTLLNAIASKAKTLADNAQIAANNAQTTANNSVQKGTFYNRVKISNEAGIQVIDLSNNERVKIGQLGQPAENRYGFQLKDPSSGAVVIDDRGIMQTWQDSRVDNVSSDKKLKLNIYLPSNTKGIIACKLRFKLENFRAFAIATQNGGASTQTSSAGGSTSATSSAGGGTTQTSSSGGGGSITSSAGGGTNVTSSSGGGQTVSSTSPYDGGVSNQTGQPNGYDMNYHTHYFSLPSHTHNVSTSNHSHTVNVSDHSHSVPIPDHTHTTTIPDHSHSVPIGNHQHTVDIPAHSHGITYGIFESTSPANITVTINETDRTSALGGDTGFIYGQNDLDIMQFMQTNQWNTIELGSSQLGRIDASVFIQALMGV